MSACDFSETVAVERVHLTALLETLCHTAPVPDPLEDAVQELAHALHGQADVGTWIVPAEALWVALYYADAQGVYDLEESTATDAHPGVVAEKRVYSLLAFQAPRTTAAMEAVSEAGLTILQRVAERHGSYLYASATVRERRCLICETAHPCQMLQAVGGSDITPV